MNITIAHDIAIVSGWDESLECLARVSWPNKAEYCKARGYSAHGVRFHHELGFWSKMAAAKELIDNYKWIFVLDLDTVIMDFHRKIEDIINCDKNDVDLILTYDINGINLGASFWRCTSWSKYFLNKIMNPPGNERFPHEQEAVARFLPLEPKDKWLCFPQRNFNSYCYELYKDIIPNGFNEGQYHDGHFLIHVPGLPLDRKIDVIKEKLLQVKK